MDEFENKVTTDETVETPSEPVNETANETASEPTRPVVEPISGVSYYAPDAGVEPSGTVGTVALVLGIISTASVLLCCCCGYWYLTLGTGIAALICGIVARNRGFKNGKTTAAIVLGIIGIAFALLMALFELLLTVTGGMILAPLLEMYGIDMEGLMELVESGATDAEIEQWIMDQMTEAGFVMEAKARITTAFNSVRGFFLK